jgi:hypothetical protein
MRLTLYLSSSSDAGAKASVELTGPGVKDSTVSFPPARALSEHFIDTSSNMIKVLRIAFLVDNEALAIEVLGLPSDSFVSLLALPDRTFLGSIYHATSTVDCVVTCADGTLGRNCVFCTRNGIKVRVCC